MHSIIFSINTVLPIFITGLIGYMLKCKNIITQEFALTLSKIVFKLFIPAMLFEQMYRQDLTRTLSLKLVLICVIGLFSVMVIAAIICPMFKKENAKCGAVVHAAFRSNYVLLGIPLMMNLYGQDGANVAASMTSFVIISLNLCAVITFSIFKPDEEKVNGSKILGVLKSILANPFIIAIVAGMLIHYAGIHLPVFIEKSLGNISAVAMPMALLALGGMFDWNNARNNLRLSTVICIIRLVIVPAVMITIAYMLGLTGVELCLVYVIFGSPVPTSAAAMAAGMKSDVRLTGEFSLMTTLFSPISFFFGVLFLRLIGAV
ncbi:MAG: AEC family transporter [Acetivibrionales bacterium]